MFPALSISDTFEIRESSDIQVDTSFAQKEKDILQVRKTSDFACQDIVAGAQKQAQQAQEQALQAQQAMHLAT